MARARLKYPRALHVTEPKLLFGYGQTAEYVKDGLFLFGPLERLPGDGGMPIGVVGTREGVQRFSQWSTRIRGRISVQTDKPHKSAWPGFAEVFSTEWPAAPLAELQIDDKELHKAIRRQNRHEAVYEAVGIYEAAISRYLASEERHPAVWFVVVPEDVYKLCRPEQTVPVSERTGTCLTVSSREAHKLLDRGTSLLFPEWQAEAEKTLELEGYEVNFHNQLKARMLNHRVVVQIVRETTIAPDDFLNAAGQPIRRVDDPATIAWNLCTTAFFKAQGKPWQLQGVRDGVCYVGIVYKQLHQPTNDANACCGAQMFLDSGDGVVFKGVEGNWYQAERKECHISEEKAKDLMTVVLSAYKDRFGKPPREIFVHGRAAFNDAEWSGFEAAVDKSVTKIVGIKIRPAAANKLYRAVGSTPVLRGSAVVLNPRRALFWTKGYVPRLQTYPGWEVPSPIEVSVVRGESEIEHVLKDILGLTKLNYNAAIYGDGVPVTLRFANAVGEILTSIPSAIQYKPLPFRYYI